MGYGNNTAGANFGQAELLSLGAKVAGAAGAPTELVSAIEVINPTKAAAKAGAKVGAPAAAAKKAPVKMIVLGVAVIAIVGYLAYTKMPEATR